MRSIFTTLVVVLALGLLTSSDAQALNLKKLKDKIDSVGQKVQDGLSDAVENVGKGISIDNDEQKLAPGTKPVAPKTVEPVAKPALAKKSSQDGAPKGIPKVLNAITVAQMRLFGLPVPAPGDEPKLAAGTKPVAPKTAKPVPVPAADVKK